ncbi:hypothetical protein [Hydrogenimonas sp.]
MAKKKKKLIKYNQTIRKIFGGEGFDEGITRVPLDNLIEMAMILSLKEQHLSKADLVRAFRRLWSNGDAADRALITEYLKSLDTVFKADRTVTGNEERMAKIDEMLAQVAHTPAEAVAIREQFSEVRLKKITPKKIARALLKLRNAKKRGDLEAKFDGAFDEEGRFVFFHAFAFELGGERFHKILQLVCTPFDEETVEKAPLEELERRLEACKKEAVAKKEAEVAAFLQKAARPNRYLRDEEILHAVRRLPESCDLRFAPIP